MITETTIKNKERMKMNEKTMMNEIVRIVNAALEARNEYARLGKGGMKTPASAYKLGQIDALERFTENLVQAFGIEIVDDKAVAK